MMIPFWMFWVCRRATARRAEAFALATDQDAPRQGRPMLLTRCRALGLTALGCALTFSSRRRAAPGRYTTQGPPPCAGGRRK